MGMARLIQLLLAAIVASTAIASPVKRQTKCASPSVRVSWHDMSTADKKAYIAAEQCILRSPAKTNKMPGAVTRWDEFASLHQLHALQIHSTGQFLPYHRYFLHIHEFLLAECGYKGTLPYWDETRDVSKLSASPVFDTTLGFGGTGSGTGACLKDGPFYNMTVNIGPGFTTKPRCINRKITDALGSLMNQAAVTKALAPKTYEEAWISIYNGPHLGGHMALAMMNGDSITSSGDPLFMLHHGFVDKMWWTWQMQAPEKRLTEMGGPNAQDPAVGFLEFSGGIEQESAMWGKPTAAMLAVTPDPHNGDNGNVTTLNHVMTSLGIIPDATIADVMDTAGSYLCYTYK